MSLTEHQVGLLRSSFARLGDALEPHSLYFYEALFRHAPEVRPLFREDLAGQGMRFMATLGIILADMRDPAANDARFGELGALHATLGIRAEHFAPMEEALIDTLRNALDDDFTAELEQAWRAAFGHVSAQMIVKGAIAEH
ncbi:MAG: globin domain-containing protein [Pseudomonadota bacterium]